MHFKISAMLLITTSLFADPWGVDADLVNTPLQKKELSQTVLQQTAKTLIRFHQNNISKCDGPRSHFYPSSSQYTLDAIQKHGFLYGFLLGCDRLMRENNDPWVYSTLQGKYNALKYDPVK